MYHTFLILKMFSCKLCTHNCETITVYVDHLEKKHKFESGCQYACPLADCDRVFSNKYRLKTHAYNHEKNNHSENISSKKKTVTIENRFIVNMKKVFYTEKRKLKHEIENSVENFVASVMEQNITRSAQQQIITAASCFNQCLFENFKKLFINIFQAKLGQEQVPVVDEMFTVFSNALQPFDTEYKRLKHFKQNEFFVSPVSYVIGHAEVGRVSNNAYVVEEKKVTGEYVSIKKTVEVIFNRPNFSSVVLDFMHSLIQKKSQSEKIEHFVQGDLFSKYTKKFPEEITIPIKIYYDELETNAPLGSHTGVHKVGGIYFRFLCLPPELSSKLENIFLNTIFNANDRKNFGNHKTLKPLLNELIKLDKKPIKLQNGPKIFIRAFIVTGDNLGVHELLGFVQSFAANFPCRICKIPREYLIIPHSEEEKFIRTVKSYEEDVKLKNVTETGINHECIFNNLSYYHCIENSTCDTMHDIAEGVCRYVLSSLILHYVNEKNFSLDYLNDRLGRFHYGSTTNSNRVAYLQSNKLAAQTLGLSASETLQLTRNFGLIIGDKVPHDDDYWEIYTTLNKIVRILNERLIDTNTLEDFKLASEKLLKLYASLFNKNVMFKLHILLHYPRLMKKLGPLQDISCMRDEAKHKDFKITAHMTTCRINLPKTLALKHQMKMCAKLIKDSTLQLNLIAGNPDKSCKAWAFYDNYKELFNNNYPIKNVTIKGIFYEKNMVLKLPCTENHSFGLIKFILYSGDQVYFILEKYVSHKFNDHYQAYEVEASDFNTFIVQDYSKLIEIIPSNILSSAEGKTFIIY